MQTLEHWSSVVLATHPHQKVACHCLEAAVGADSLQGKPYVEHIAIVWP